MTLANMTQEETNKRNREYCKYIADGLELIAYGQAYKCTECGEVIDCEEYAEQEELYDAITEGDICTCPRCKEKAEFEQMSIYEWLEDTLDIQYTINADMSYYAGRVMVTCGGPNIYVDTLYNAVRLFWWGDRAEYELSRTACDALDECLEELYQCGR